VLQLNIDAASHKLPVGQGVSLAQSLAQNQRMLDVQQSEEFRKIVAWLSAADPWTNHDSARQQHGSQTGNWLLQADQYKKWKLDATSHLWMYGKTGCGKTVLCSTAVVYIQELCRDSAHHFYLESVTGHGILAQSCLTYLRHYSSNSDKTSTKKDLEKFALLEYAAQSWFYHAALQKATAPKPQHTGIL
jgi:hypothetical protein